MIKLGGRASWLVVNSSRVQLEGHVGSINGNRDWVVSNGVLKSSFRSRGNISVVGDGGTNVGSVEFAGVWSCSSVWVGFFGINSVVGNDVLEGLIHQTTIATHVALSSGAVNQVLFGEGDELFSLQEVDSFDGSSGGEGPARTALSLVFDWGDSSFLSPVDFRWDTGSKSGESGMSRSGFGDVHSIVDGDEFGGGEISEFV